MKRRIDIEELLTWAYVVELPNRELSSAEWNWTNMGGYGALGGVRVSEGSGLQRYATIGAPHADAVAIETAVRELPAKMDAASDGKSVSINYADSAALLFSDSPRLAPASMSLCAFNLPTLLISHAVRKARPRWYVGRVTLRRRTGMNGKPVVIGRNPTTHRYEEGAYCPLDCEPPLRTIAEARAEYLLWRLALAELVRNLTDSLIAHVPTGPVATLEPWLERGPESAESLVTPEVIREIRARRKRRWMPAS